MTTATSQPRAPSQMDLIQSIVEELQQQGFKDFNTRQFNAVIEAADLVVREFGTPHAPAVASSGLRVWLASDDTGLSSRAMAARLAPLIGERGPAPAADHPLDPSDFGRCVRLMEAEPRLRPHLPAMADVSPVWGRLVAVWGELEALYREELPKGRAPRLYDRMRALIDNETGGQTK